MTGGTAGVRLPRVRGDAADAEDDAGVLDAVVGVVELRADAADLGAEGVADHLVEPVGVNDGKVVVEKADQRGVGVLNREIIERGEIEFTGGAEDADGSRAIARQRAPPC